MDIASVSGTAYCLTCKEGGASGVYRRLQVRVLAWSTFLRIQQHPQQQEQRRRHAPAGGAAAAANAAVSRNSWRCRRQAAAADAAAAEAAAAMHQPVLPSVFLLLGRQVWHSTAQQQESTHPTPPHPTPPHPTPPHPTHPPIHPPALAHPPAPPLPPCTRKERGRTITQRRMAAVERQQHVATTLLGFSATAAGASLAVWHNEHLRT